MPLTPHCHRCGYANAPTWARCCCCGRPVADHRIPRKARVVRAPAGVRPPRPRRRAATRPRAVLAPALSMGAVAGAWLSDLSADQRAGALTGAAALSAFAALARREAPRGQPASRATPAAAPTPAAPAAVTPMHGRRRSEDRVEDLAAIIAAW